MAATHNTASAQQSTNPMAQPPRSEFFSYELREDAAAGAIIKSQFFNSIPAEANQNGVCAVQFYAPYAFGDRNVFFRSEGGAGAYQLFVNNRLVGGSVDAYTPSEMYISPYLIDGQNVIRIEACESGAAQSVEAMYKAPVLAMGGNSYIMSQPKVYIEDFDIKTSPDSTTNHGLLDLHIVVRNSSRADQHIALGFDIYDPKGKLKTYDVRELDMTPGDRDTVRFHNIVYSTAKYLWSAENPTLYALTMYIKQYGSVTEYVPWAVGWGTTTYTPRAVGTSGVLMRNDAPVEMRAVEYTPKYNLPMEEQVRQLKRKGYNTIVLSMPAQIALYRACDKVGMYVIDCPAIYADPKGGSRARHNGTALNNPDYLNEVLYRTLAMQRRTRNHSCVVAWSLAAGGGNGYNLYKSYQLLHELDTLRPAVYRFAEGEWNNDLVLPNPETLE
jgi:beta-galactosidase